MADSTASKRSVREMINAHLFPVLALIGTASSVSIALSLGPIAGQASRWNKCYNAGMAYLGRIRPNVPPTELQAIATNYCNGGLKTSPKN